MTTVQFATQRAANCNAFAHGLSVERNGPRVEVRHSWVYVTELANAGKRGKDVRVLRACVENEADPSGVAATLAESDSWDIACEIAQMSGLLTETAEERGIDVPPSGFERLTFNDAEWYMTVGWNELRIACLLDHHNEPRGYVTKRSWVAKVRKWAATDAGREALKNARSMYAVCAAIFDATGVRVHTYCAMD